MQTTPHMSIAVFLPVTQKVALPCTRTAFIGATAERCP